MGEVAEKVNILVECGDRVLYKSAKAKVLPGEMESVTVKAEKLAGLEEIPNAGLTVRLEKR